MELNEKHSLSEELSKQIPKMLILGVVGSFDHHISLLLREILSKYPNIIESSERQVTLSEILATNNIEEFKSYILNNEIEKIIGIFH